MKTASMTIDGKSVSGFFEFDLLRGIQEEEYRKAVLAIANAGHSWAFEMSGGYQTLYFSAPTLEEAEALWRRAEERLTSAREQFLGSLETARAVVNLHIRKTLHLKYGDVQTEIAGYEKRRKPDLISDDVFTEAVRKIAYAAIQKHINPELAGLLADQQHDSGRITTLESGQIDHGRALAAQLRQIADNHTLVTDLERRMALAERLIADLEKRLDAPKTAKADTPRTVKGRVGKPKKA